MRKSYKRKNTKRRGGKTQKLWRMKGCAGVCKKCGPNCRCGPRCNCRHKCGGNCYKNRMMMHGGSSDAPLAYTGKPVHSVANPHFAYSGTNQKGGMIPAAVPALFDTRWSSPVSTWPGVSGPHSGSFLKFNTYDNQPEMNPIHESYPENGVVSSGGGRKTRRRRRRRMGGGGAGIFAQMGSDLTNAYRQFNGQPANPSPLPWKDQMFNNRSGQEDNLNYLKVG